MNKTVSFDYSKAIGFDSFDIKGKDVDKRLASRSDHDRSVRNDMERTAVIKSAYGNRKMRQMTNNAYKHVGARLGIK